MDHLREATHMRVKLSTDEILNVLEGVVAEGVCETSIEGIASLEQAGSGDLSFLGNAKYRRWISSSKASVILLPEDYEGSPKDDQLYLRVKNPSFALAQICKVIESRLFPLAPEGIHETAWVHPNAQINARVRIGAFASVGEDSFLDEGVVLEEHVTVGRHVKVGKNCRLRPRVVIGDYCELGQRIILQPGVILGSDGYGYDFVKGQHCKVPHVGKVVIEDDVEIGANTTVDRSRFSKTLIGAGTKIDNLVQIAHNVMIGKNCLIVAQAGISGSTVIEDNTVIGGQAGLAGHLHVGSGAKIAAQAGITKDVEPGAYLKGNPALPYMLAQRIAVIQKKLPDFFKRFADQEPSA